jgi:hypothetical protein
MGGLIRGGGHRVGNLRNSDSSKITHIDMVG